MRNQAWTGNQLLLVVSALLLCLDNHRFFTETLKVYPPVLANLPPLLSLAGMLFGLHLVLLGMLTWGRLTRVLLVLVLIVAALAAHFIDTLGTPLGTPVLLSVWQTDFAEARELVTPRLLLDVVFLGLLPAALIWRLPLAWRGWRRELVARLQLLTTTLLAMAALLILFSSFYAGFLRAHKSLRSFANPAYGLVSTMKLLAMARPSGAHAQLQAMATDARIDANDPGRELIVLVIGETARADRFGTNGYARNTTPQLAAAGAISLTRVEACGTSTAQSLPCLFSARDRAHFDLRKTASEENLLDIVQRAGVHVLWLDNNSDSKGVALRVPYRDFRSPANNPVCDVECRDEGMLAPLQDFVDQHPAGDLLIVLHQRGSHGPAYFRRYPPEREIFTPACHREELNRCSREEIDNAYDNTIAYTDHFLGQVIAWLQANDARFETALFYISDHGESLGENGIYLHGLPRHIAPAAQLHVPALLWFGRHHDDLDVAALRRHRNQPFSHDHFFHTVLGLLEIRTQSYQPQLDLLAPFRRPRVALATAPHPPGPP